MKSQKQLFNVLLISILSYVGIFAQGRQIIANGTYFIRNPFNSQRLIIDNNNNAKMANSNRNNNQRWQITHLGSNNYRVRNVGKNRFLEVPRAQCGNGINVASWIRANQNHQKWKISRNGGNFSFKPLHCMDRAMDRRRGVNNANAHIFRFSSSNNNQKWIITSVSSGGGTPPPNNNRPDGNPQPDEIHPLVQRAINQSQGVTYRPRHPAYTDSYSVNNQCFCASTFDHNLRDADLKIFYRINGVKRSLVDVCDELTRHPSYRARRNGDNPYNDIQCGNGPSNTAADESGCPGRTDLGTAGCDQKGPEFDLNWLQRRSRFSASRKLLSANNSDNVSFSITPNPIIVGGETYLNVNATEDALATVSLYDLSGKHIASIKHTEFEDTISGIEITGLIKTVKSSGIYILTYKAGNSYKAQQVIIK